MKYVCFIALLCGVLFANAEARYKVESLTITGAQNYRLSKELLQQIQELIGRTLNPEALDNVVQGIGNELGGQPVSKHVVPGDDPEHVKVVVEVGGAKDEPPAGTGEAAPEVNVNSRYTVEDIQIKGVSANRLSEDVNEQLHQLVGKKFNQGALDDLARRIKKELHARSVSQTLSRGAKPEHIKVVLDVVARKEDETDFHLSKYVYQSKQAWSTKAFGEFDIASKTSVLVGLVSDSDELLERFAGIAAGFENRKVLTDRVRLRFLFETYHNQWNGATLQALETSPDIPGIYRNRKSFQPVATFEIGRASCRERV